MSHSRAAGTPEWTHLCVDPPEGRFDVTALKMGEELTSFNGREPRKIAVYSFPATRMQDFIAGGPPAPRTPCYILHVAQAACFMVQGGLRFAKLKTRVRFAILQAYEGDWTSCVVSSPTEGCKWLQMQARSDGVLAKCCVTSRKRFSQVKYSILGLARHRLAANVAIAGLYSPCSAINAITGQRTTV